MYNKKNSVNIKLSDLLKQPEKHSPIKERSTANENGAPCTLYLLYEIKRNIEIDEEGDIDTEEEEELLNDEEEVSRTIYKNF